MNVAMYIGYSPIEFRSNVMPTMTMNDVDSYIRILDKSFSESKFYQVASEVQSNVQQFLLFNNIQVTGYPDQDFSSLVQHVLSKYLWIQNLTGYPMDICRTIYYLETVSRNNMLSVEAMGMCDYIIYRGLTGSKKNSFIGGSFLDKLIKSIVESVSGGAGDVASSATRQAIIDNWIYVFAFVILVTFSVSAIRS